MALKDIIGQEKALGILRGCIEKNRIPHALLFAGDEGIGKRLTAINFAKALNCQGKEHRAKSVEETGLDFGFFPPETQAVNTDPQSPTPNPLLDSCDTCPSCVKIDKGIHPDFFLIETEGDGDQIKIEAVRQLEEALSYKPYEGSYKVAIVDNADKMNSSAANAFLSTLESPPSQSIIILVSSKPDRLLPTIRSRCQRINFAPLPVEMMSGLVKEKYKKLDDEQALLLSVLSGGRLGYALNENLVAQRDRSFNIFNQMLSGSEDDVRDDKLSMEEWFDWAQLWLRDIAVFKATGQTAFLINKDKAGEIQALAGKAALREVLKLARELYNIRGQLNFNLNEKLTFNYTGLLMRKRLGKINAGRQ
ncbi:MAG: DNA polymerase III subunit delta' [Nitrospirae bacterium]|nr:DNA polymerase III subunit delta' [Nitrospirota bacterium]